MSAVGSRPVRLYLAVSRGHKDAVHTFVASLPILPEEQPDRTRRRLIRQCLRDVFADAHRRRPRGGGKLLAEVHLDSSSPTVVEELRLALDGLSPEADS